MHKHTEDSKFAVHNRNDILSILNELKNSRASITMGSTDGESFPTTVIDTNLENVFLDVCSVAKVNEHISHCKHILFSTSTGIAIKWYSSHASLIDLPDGKAFSIAFPASIQRVQRREHFRLPIRRGGFCDGMTCTISAPDESELSLKILDMSGGGMGLHVPKELPEYFSQGAILDKCSVNFPSIGLISFKLKVCWITPLKNGKIDNGLHVGMEFVDLSRGAENIIQKHMIALEAEHRTTWANV